MPLLGNYEQAVYPYYDRIINGGVVIPITMGENGTLESFWCFFARTSDASDGRIWGGLYDGFEASGNVLLDESDTYVTATSADDDTALEMPTTTGYGLANGAEYGCAVTGTVGGSYGECRIYEKDSTYAIGGYGISGYNYASSTDPSWADPMTLAGGDARSWQTWIEYSTGGGGGSRIPRKRRAIGNIPMGAALQLRRRGVEVVTCDLLARERARSRVTLPQNWYSLGDLKNGNIRRNSGPSLSLR